MADKPENEHLKALQELRDYVVKTRRDTAAATGDPDGRIKHIIKCQDAIRVLDEAIADERRLGPKPTARSYPMRYG